MRFYSLRHAHGCALKGTIARMFCCDFCTRTRARARSTATLTPVHPFLRLRSRSRRHRSCSPDLGASVPQVLWRGTEGRVCDAHFRDSRRFCGFVHPRAGDDEAEATGAYLCLSLSLARALALLLSSLAAPRSGDSSRSRRSLIATPHFYSWLHSLTNARTLSLAHVGPQAAAREERSARRRPSTSKKK